MSRFGNLEFEARLNLPGQTRETGEVHWWTEGRSAFERAEFEPALRCYSRVLEYNPRHLGSWVGQIRALIELAEIREARLWSDKALERFPDEPELLAAKAVALARSGETDAALAFSDASLERRGDAVYLWLARADVLLMRQEHRADYCFDRAFSLTPKDWVTAWLAARIRLYHGHWMLALREARRALEWNPLSLAAWLAAGECENACGFPDHARRSFRRALELDSRCLAATEALQKFSTESVWTRLAGKWRQFFRA